MGAAIFNGDTMVGEINGNENRLMLMARGDFKRGFFTIQDPQNKRYIVPLDVRQEKVPDITVSFINSNPVIHMKLYLYAEILAIQAGMEYENPKLMPLLEATFKQELKNGMDKLLLKCQSMGVDIFGFGNTAVRHFGTIQEWETYNWIKQFQTAKISTDVEFQIRRTGTLLKDSPIVFAGGKGR